jgi:membrane-anchored protein YejM (alkaline phosphatase superfamily)
VISSKYSGYAVISEDTISVINSRGGYEIYDRHYHPKDVRLDAVQMKEAFEAISRFMK